MKLTELSSDDVMLNAIADDPERLAGQPHRPHGNAKLMPPEERVYVARGWSQSIASGVYEVHPDFAAPPGTKKLPSMITALMKKRMTVPMFSRGKAMSTVPICSGMTKLPNAAKPIGHDAEEHHDRAVHRAERVVKIAAS